MALKFLVVLCIICAVQGIDYHDTLGDDYDMSLLTPEELKEMTQCINKRGPCTDLAESYRKHYPDVMIEACGRCSPVQKHTAHEFYKRVMKELPEEFKAIKDLYDPQGKYFDRFYNSFKDF